MAVGSNEPKRLVFGMGHTVTVESRRDMIAAVLEGARGTYRVLLDLTEDELHDALALEYASQRRHSVMKRLIARAAALQRARLIKRYLS